MELECPTFQTPIHLLYVRSGMSTENDRHPTLTIIMSWPVCIWIASTKYGAAIKISIPEFIQVRTLLWYPYTHCLKAGLSSGTFINYWNLAHWSSNVCSGTTSLRFDFSSICTTELIWQIALGIFLISLEQNLPTCNNEHCIYCEVVL